MDPDLPELRCGSTAVALPIRGAASVDAIAPNQTL